MRSVIAGLSAVLTFALALAVQAQTALDSGLAGDQYRPAIWIDPDGCQHWVMDDGQRGFMDPVRTMDGKPVCLRGARAKNDPVFPVPDTAEAFIPAIWIDPDGCQHWAMDERGRGFMDMVLDRAGKPVCGRPAPVCGSFAADQLFGTASAVIPAGEKARLSEFFRSKGGTAVQIAGHTDSRGSAASNMALGKARAAAVASVARASGAKVASVVSFGETWPAQSNKTPVGMAANRRVEISCVN
jgi:OmpA family